MCIANTVVVKVIIKSLARKWKRSMTAVIDRNNPRGSTKDQQQTGQRHRKNSKKKKRKKRMAPTQTVACESAKDDPAHCWAGFRPVCVWSYPLLWRLLFFSWYRGGLFFFFFFFLYSPLFLSEADRRQRYRLVSWPLAVAHNGPRKLSTQSQWGLGRPAQKRNNKKSIETLY